MFKKIFVSRVHSQLKTDIYNLLNHETLGWIGVAVNFKWVGKETAMYSAMYMQVFAVHIVNGIWTLICSRHVCVEDLYGLDVMAFGIILLCV